MISNSLPLLNYPFKPTRDNREGAWNSHGHEHAIQPVCPHTSSLQPVQVGHVLSEAVPSQPVRHHQYHLLLKHESWIIKGTV